MASQLVDIENRARIHLIEPTPNFWTSAELWTHISAGCKDLWRSIVDLKQEHFLHINTTDVVMPASLTPSGGTTPAGAIGLTGLPTDIHKVYNIEPVNMGENGDNVGLIYKPKDFNHDDFKLARTRPAITPSNDTIYYHISLAGAPAGITQILCAPLVTANVAIAFGYIPILQPLVNSTDQIPIPGEADNALVAWCVAYARVKESEDRAPDANWLAIYNTEKEHLMQSLGLRQYQEPKYGDALFQDYW